MLSANISRSCSARMEASRSASPSLYAASSPLPYSRTFAASSVAFGNLGNEAIRAMPGAARAVIGAGFGSSAPSIAQRVVPEVAHIFVEAAVAEAARIETAANQFQPVRNLVVQVYEPWV